MSASAILRVPVFSDVAGLRARVGEWKRAGERVAIVPTMGALHRGHLTLVAEARKRAQRVIVSIFVNPTQFAPTEDFSAYPRTFEDDLAKLAGAKADVCFAPAVPEMYPEGFATTIKVAGPAQADLEDRFRPTHFAGVVTVVAKLLTQSQADAAFFGEKDYQQLKVVARMARDLDLPTEIVGIETVRESDGLALSSRNVYLTPCERRIAPTIHRTLTACAQAIREGESAAHAAIEAAKTLAEAGFALDYLEARHAHSLARIESLADGPIRLLVAARLGKTRLIDNVGV